MFALLLNDVRRKLAQESAHFFPKDVTTTTNDANYQLVVESEMNSIKKNTWDLVPLSKSLRALLCRCMLR